MQREKTQRAKCGASLKILPSLVRAEKTLPSVLSSLPNPAVLNKETHFNSASTLEPKDCFSSSQSEVPSSAGARTSSCRQTSGHLPPFQHGYYISRTQNRIKAPCIYLSLCLHTYLLIHLLISHSHFKCYISPALKWTFSVTLGLPSVSGPLIHTVSLDVCKGLVQNPCRDQNRHAQVPKYIRSIFI